MNPTAAHVAAIPTALGEYDLLEQIGIGGMGQVYKARHRRMDRIVALKILPEGAITSADALARFHQEVQTAAKLHHPNIVTAYDAGEIGGRPYLVMEFVEGQDLARHLQSHGSLPVDQAIEIVAQVALAMEYAHGKGIVHGDIKPGNLLLTADGVVKVLDLGLARFKATVAGEPAAGTVDYLPPERMVFSAPVDPRSDIYSLGCTLFTLLTGKPLFPGRTAVEKMLAHRTGQVPSLRQERPDVPVSLENVFRRMVAHDVADRWQSMAQVAEALKEKKPSRWKPWPTAILIGVVLLIAGASGYFTFFGFGKGNVEEENHAKLLNDDATDRQAARWAAKIGGWADVVEHSTGERVTIRGEKELPAGSMRVIAIGLAGNREVTDEGLVNLAGLKAIDQINLVNTPIKGPGLKHLSGLTSLTYLNLHATQVDDAGLAHLKGLTNLRALGPGWAGNYRRRPETPGRADEPHGFIAVEYPDKR